jgi:hypothetical protein
MSFRTGEKLFSFRSIPFARFTHNAPPSIKYKHHKDSAHNGRYDKTCNACKDLRWRKK